MSKVEYPFNPPLVQGDVVQFKDGMGAWYIHSTLNKLAIIHSIIYHIGTPRTSIKQVNIDRLIRITRPVADHVKMKCIVGNVIRVENNVGYLTVIGHKVNVFPSHYSFEYICQPYGNPNGQKRFVKDDDIVEVSPVLLKTLTEASGPKFVQGETVLHHDKKSKLGLCTVVKTKLEEMANKSKGWVYLLERGKNTYGRISEQSLRKPTRDDIEVGCTVWLFPTNGMPERRIVTNMVANTVYLDFADSKAEEYSKSAVCLTLDGDEYPLFNIGDEVNIAKPSGYTPATIKAISDIGAEPNRWKYSVIWAGGIDIVYQDEGITRVAIAAFVDEEITDVDKQLAEEFMNEEEETKENAFHGKILAQGSIDRLSEDKEPALEVGDKGFIFIFKESFDLSEWDVISLDLARKKLDDIKMQNKTDNDSISLTKEVYPVKCLILRKDEKKSISMIKLIDKVPELSLLGDTYSVNDWLIFPQSEEVMDVVSKLEAKASCHKPMEHIDSLIKIDDEVVFFLVEDPVTGNRVIEDIFAYLQAQHKLKIHPIRGRVTDIYQTNGILVKPHSRPPNMMVVPPLLVSYESLTVVEPMTLDFIAWAATQCEKINDEINSTFRPLPLTSYNPVFSPIPQCHPRQSRYVPGNIVLYRGLPVKITKIEYSSLQHKFFYAILDVFNNKALDGWCYSGIAEEELFPYKDPRVGKEVMYGKRKVKITDIDKSSLKYAFEYLYPASLGDLQFTDFAYEGQLTAIVPKDTVKRDTRRSTERFTLPEGLSRIITERCLEEDIDVLTDLFNVLRRVPDITLILNAVEGGINTLTERHRESNVFLFEIDSQVLNKDKQEGTIINRGTSKFKGIDANWYDVMVMPMGCIYRYTEDELTKA